MPRQLIRSQQDRRGVQVDFDALLWKHVLDLFVTESYLVYRVSLSFEAFKIAFDVGRQEDLWRTVG